MLLLHLRGRLGVDLATVLVVARRRGYGRGRVRLRSVVDRGVERARHACGCDDVGRVCRCARQSLLLLRGRRRGISRKLTCGGIGARRAGRAVWAGVGVVGHVLRVLGDLAGAVLGVLLRQSVAGLVGTGVLLLLRCGRLLLLVHDAGGALVRQLLRRRALRVVRLMLL